MSDDNYEFIDGVDSATAAHYEEILELEKKVDTLEATVFQLANALWPYRDDWDENSGSSYNVQRKQATADAISAARRYGWSP